MKTREDIYRFYESLAGVTKAYRTEYGSLNLGSSGTHYSRNQIEAEGFLRQLWAVGPIQGIQPNEDFAFYKNGILNGVDPTSKGYWGKVSDYDQLIVEMTPLAVTLMTTQDTFWGTLSGQEQENIYNWLNQINKVQFSQNNWIFFRILVNVAFIQLNLPHDAQRLVEDLTLIDDMYIGDGWYMDGNEHQMDYYIPWAFHYYGLLYAVFMKEHEPERAECFIERAKTFAQDFIYWFDDQGAGVPFGRSLTYRFAQGAFWSALVYADVEAIPWGEIKYILCHHLSYWEKQSITKSDGILSIGYCYENLYMSESYNGPGSSYWAFKTFLILGVPKTHSFWSAKMKKPEKKLGIRKLTPAKMLISTEADGNVQMYPTNQFTNQVHAAEKYSKFVYSTRFGFSVSKDRKGLRAGAYDNTLAVAEQGTDFYFIKEIGQSSGVYEDYVRHKWQPMKEVDITSYIVPIAFGHVRIHVIDTKRELLLADGGYAVRTMNSHPKDYIFTEEMTHAALSGENGYVASFHLAGYNQAELVFSDPNTNLLYTNSALPTLKGQAEQGTHIYVSAHFGSEEARDFPLPEVTRERQGFIVKHEGKIINISEE